MFRKKFLKEEKRLRNSFKYAIEGIISSFKSEKNMNVHFMVMVLVIILGLIVKLTKQEWIICILLFGIVISSEIMNTAIEATVDLASPKIHPKAKKAKDTAAGSVLITAIISAIIGLMIFIPRITELIEKFN